MKTMVALRKWATRAAAVTEDVACKGTALESTTFKLRAKAFLFVQPMDDAYVVRLKLESSLAEATRLGHEVGKNGWVKIALESADPPAVLAKWIDESQSIVAAPPAPRVKARTTAIAGKKAR